MRDLVHPLAGFETSVIPWFPQLTANNVVIGMEGWEWFLLSSVDMTIDNTGGGVSATPLIFTSFGGQNVVRAVASVAALAGGSTAAYFGLLSSIVNLAGVLQSVSLPFVFNPQGSTINISFGGGDGATRIGKGSCVVHGIKRSTLNKR